MENFTIVSTTTNVQAKQDVNGVTVNYNYNHEEGKAPLAIVFGVVRDGGEINGTYYTQNDKFDVKTTAYKAGDSALQESIFNTCQDIVQSLTSNGA